MTFMRVTPQLIQAVVDLATGSGRDPVALGVGALGAHWAPARVRSSTAGADRRHGSRGHLAECLLLCDVERPDPILFA